MELIEELGELDTSWILKYENDEYLYKQFYKEPNTSLKVYLLYTNESNEIERINEKNISLSLENLLSQNDLLKLIKNNQIIHNIKYNLKNLFIYNLDLDPDQITNYIHKPNDFNFIQEIKTINDINLNSTIFILNELNSLFIVYSLAKPRDHSLSHTKKLIIHNNKKYTRKRI